MRNALLVVSGVSMGLLAALGISAAGGPAEAAAQSGPAGGAGAPGESMILGTGGSAQNQNDLCWILARVKPVRGPERTVLALYRAKRQGELFDLEDVRFIDADLRLVELQGKMHQPTVQEVLKSLPKEEQEALRPPSTP